MMIDIAYFCAKTQYCVCMFKHLLKFTCKYSMTLIISTLYFILFITFSTYKRFISEYPSVEEQPEDVNVVGGSGLCLCR